MIDLANRLRSHLGGDRSRGPSNPNADAEIARQSEAIAGDFDANFYAVRYPEVPGDLLRHFVTIGWREGRDPAPWFSMQFYAETHPDVVAAGLNPFYHYVSHGREEGRAIAPADSAANDRAWEIEAVRRGIDEDFYREQLRIAGIDPGAIDPAVHYWREGVGLGLDPAEDFSTAHYLQAHADVAAAGVNPLAHYIEQGKREGRTARAAEKRSEPVKEDHRSLVESGFDEAYYLAAYPDVAAAGVDPLNHFLNEGWREGRNPNPWFSVADYLDSYPDIGEARINPFLHYLLAGKAEGRAPRHELGFRYDIIKSLVPLEQRIDQARKSAPARKLSDASVLRAALGKAKRLEANGLYLTVSHDDFTENFGGVQLVLMRESAAMEQRGLDHLHLFPGTALPVAKFADANQVVGVVLNRKRIGFFRASDIARELGAASARIAQRDFAIHSLIGHNAEALISILGAAGCRSGWYWVHDYSSVCTGYTLLRNDVEFCGGPPPTSTACSICVYGGLRTKQMAEHQRLFDALDLTVLAPSEAALDVWKASFPSAAPARVHRHLRLASSSKPMLSDAAADRPLAVAYVGLPVSHKGWPAFRDLALRFAGDERYRFHHVGKQRQPGVPAAFTEVAVGPDDLDEMSRTLRELEIDVAIFWSLWPETFCIAAVEALTAGAAVVTFKDSGNVAALVRQTGCGAVLDNEDDLARLFDTGEIIAIAAARKPRGLTAEFSNMTADLIDGAAA